MTKIRRATRDFAAELEREIRDTHAIDDIANKDPSLRRLRGRVVALSKVVRSRADARAWGRLEDARALADAAAFRLAFNLGYENGVIAERIAAAQSKRRPSRSSRQFVLEVRRLLAAGGSSRENLVGLLDACRALADGEGLVPRAAGRAPLAKLSGRMGQESGRP
jgi:hypothetical protein